MNDTDSETENKKSNESTGVMDPNEIEIINKRNTYFDTSDNHEIINNNNETSTISENNEEDESDEEEDSDDEDDETPQLNPDDWIIWNLDGMINRITRSGRTSKPPIMLTLQQLGIEERYEEEIEYSIPTTRVIAKTMDFMNNKIQSISHLCHERCVTCEKRKTRYYDRNCLFIS
jgi:hypothetical protein